MREAAPARWIAVGRWRVRVLSPAAAGGRGGRPEPVSLVALASAGGPRRAADRRRRERGPGAAGAAAGGGAEGVAPRLGGPRAGPLLARMRPAAALISAGEGNPFRHPRPETLAALGAAGVAAWRTDRSGDVTVGARGAGVPVPRAGNLAGRWAQEPLKPAYVIWGEDRATVDRALVAAGGPGRARGGHAARADARRGDAGRGRRGGVRGALVRRAAPGDRRGRRRLEGPDAASAWSPTSTAPTRAPAWRWWRRPAHAEAARGRRRGGGELRYGPDPKAKGASGRVAGRALPLGGRARRRLDRPAVARRVVDRVMVDRADARRGGITAMELSREAEKLAAYAGGEPITAEMVEALVPRHPDAKAYELADALVRATPRAPTTCCRTWRPARTRSPPIVVQVQLTNHFRRWRRRRRSGPTVSPDAVSAATGVTRLPGPQAGRAGPGAAAGRGAARRGAPRGARARPAGRGAARPRPLP